MKLTLVLVSVAAVALSEAMNPGFKVRFTDKFLKELIRARKEFVTEQFVDLKENFGDKAKAIWKIVEKQLGDKMKKYKLKDAELVSFDDGEGWNIQFKAPNVVEMSWSGMSVEMKATIKKEGKEGTITVKGTVEKAVMGFAFTKTEKGNVEIKKTDNCELKFGDLTATVEGYGEDVDAKYNKKLAEKIAQGKTMMENMLCPWLDMGLVFVNSAIDQKECKRQTPMWEDMYVAHCLVKDPEATENYFELSFCGQTTFGDEEATHDGGYAPAELAMSDDGKTKMVYFYSAEAMSNEFMKEAFKHDKLQVELSKDKYPKAAKKVHKYMNEALKLMEKPEIPETAEVTTTFKAVDKAPQFTVAAGKMSMEATVEVAHKIDNCDSCEWTEKTVKFNIGWDWEPKLVDAKEGKVMPRFDGTFTVTKLEFIDVPEEVLAKVGDKPKEHLQKMISKLGKKWAAYREKHEDEFIPFKFFQIKNAALNSLDKTVELNGDVIFDVKKMSKHSTKLMKKHLKKSSESGDDDE